MAVMNGLRHRWRLDPAEQDWTLLVRVREAPGFTTKMEPITPQSPRLAGDTAKDLGIG